mgnify:CR=1 FL=1
MFLQIYQLILRGRKPMLMAVGQSGEQGNSGGEDVSQKEQKETQKPSFAIFRFADMRSLCEYAKVLPKNLRVISRLYRDGGTYYLYLERGGASYERYSRASIQALEFGELFAATEDKLVYLEEHGECLIVFLRDVLPAGVPLLSGLPHRHQHGLCKQSRDSRTVHAQLFF